MSEAQGDRDDALAGRRMNVLVVDVGGSTSRCWSLAKNPRRAIDSGPAMTADQMVAGVKEAAGDGNTTWC